MNTNKQEKPLKRFAIDYTESQNNYKNNKTHYEHAISKKQAWLQFISGRSLEGCISPIPDRAIGCEFRVFEWLNRIDAIRELKPIKKRILNIKTAAVYEFSYYEDEADRKEEIMFAAIGLKYI